MNCPIDGTQLLITHRNNIEIDYCPKCRGVWLDRGELDKLIERSAADMRRYDDDDWDDDDDDHEESYDKPKRDYRYNTLNQPQSHKPKRDYRYDDKRDYNDKPRKSRKRSILEEVFDFLD